MSGSGTVHDVNSFDVVIHVVIYELKLIANCLCVYVACTRCWLRVLSISCCIHI